jgi:predicted transcriptional regulator
MLIISREELEKYLNNLKDITADEMDRLRHLFRAIRTDVLDFAEFDEDVFGASLKVSALIMFMVAFIADESKKKNKCLALARDIVKIY